MPCASCRNMTVPVDVNSLEASTMVLRQPYTINADPVQRLPRFHMSYRYPLTRHLIRVISGPHISFVPCFFFWLDEYPANINAIQAGALPCFQMRWNDTKFFERMDNVYEEYLEVVDMACASTGVNDLTVQGARICDAHHDDDSGTENTDDSEDTKDWNSVATSTGSDDDSGSRTTPEAINDIKVGRDGWRGENQHSATCDPSLNLEVILRAKKMPRI